MLVGLAVGPFWVQNPNTDYVCNSTLAVPRSSPAFLDWQADIEFKLYYYLLGQAIFATLIALLGFCKCSMYDQLLAELEIIIEIICLQLYLMLLPLLQAYLNT